MDAKGIRRIARLARLSIHDDDIPSYAEKMTKLLELADKLQAVDVSQCEPLSHPLEITQPLRADEVTEVDQRELFQTLAPEVERGFYLVPQVIEQE
ncbi:MAG: Asp-tRNA(Asn)/Glu-tRNA(Gln) amidotransferase GatCAB subunit C [Gammaproteobacteria bacterium CG11_big_fil_rev_8_21_14_0_20_46_22]|nr:MAG: Asp-tRNA(Asn)/Glu-tRNA(Gln) amidotransferase GatCAB subunit C [Gammaproteobacteria bacterium CG12_big_fil_rev_8_21_14_0_65_46_12]PIR11478.1 MAG: Asp-tRNA(Asn)/Glu-tRNA(Gln) amidotransferase GatCAB subunit C [Gammaproteobacteria bacterium CG11_big_fil_rev_8_21_14_0_20_46_22]